VAPPLRRRAALAGAAGLGPLPGALYAAGGAINVRDHGATGDGKTDDAAPIQAAIDTAQRAGGGVVLLPAGTYALGRGLTIRHDAVTLVGEGQGATRLLAQPALTGDVLAFDGREAESGVYGGGVRQLTVDATVPRGEGIGVHLTDAFRVVLQDVDVHHMFIGCKLDGHGSLQYAERGFWSDFAPGGVGLWIDTVAEPPLGGNDQFVSQLVIEGVDELDLQPYAGIRITNSEAVWLTNCDVLSCRYGLAIDPAGAPRPGVVSWLFAQGCAFDSCADHGIYVNPAAGAECKGLSFVNCWSSSAQRGDGCYVGGPTDGVELLGHRFLQNAGNGLLVDEPARNVTVDASTAAGNGRSGLAFNCSDFAVRSSRSGAALGFGVSQTNGIWVGRGARRYLIADNVTTGNAQRGIADEGAEPKIVANNLGT